MRDLIGSCCIIVAGVWMLWRNKKNNRKRSEILADIMMALGNMADEVRLARIPLPDLLEQLAGKYGADTAVFFDKILAEIRQGENALAAWKKAAAELPISQSERAAVSAVGDCLRKDEESLCKGINFAMCALKKYQENWEKGRTENERRTSVLYLSGAAMLIILLI